MLAFAIDFLVVLTILVVVLVVTGFTLSTSSDAALAATVAVLAIVVSLVGYPVAIETLTRGRSLGKLALGLRVVREDGGPIRFRQALVRGLTGLFELYLLSGVPALITSLASRQGKRVGDYLAGTIVLQERVPGHTGPPVQMPPPLAGWAAGADVSGVSDALALSVRQFLARAHELHPVARAQLEAQLVAAVAAVVAPAAPPGTPGWALLAAVLAERRRRDELRRQPVGPPPPPPPGPPAPTEPGPGDFAPPG